METKKFIILVLIFSANPTLAHDDQRIAELENKIQVLELLHEHQDALQGFGIERCGLCGSFVRNEAIQPQSDVDILVAFQGDKKTFDNFIHLTFFLEDLFGRTVDLITIESLSPYIGPHILAEVEYVSLSP